MKSLRIAGCLALALGFAGACGFDDTLREYLNVHFWLPFAKAAGHFAKTGVRRVSEPFAGMQKAAGSTPIERLRAAYQQIAMLDSPDFDAGKLKAALAAVRADVSLSPGQREEVDLIDAKIDMRAGSVDNTEPLASAMTKLNAFLRTAATSEYKSEARGWLAHVHYLLGDQTAAGKIYLDELNREGSNLSRQTLVNSLRMTYGYDGGSKLLEHLEEYFDTPEHAAFAIHLVTNPRWDRTHWSSSEDVPSLGTIRAIPYARITALLERHGKLLRSDKGADLLALLGMRTAMRAGDPASALRIAANVPRRAATRSDPDFEWMLASAHFVSREYGSAEYPLLRLFRSSRASLDQKSAAAYGLCGVYQKTGNPVEQIRYALWLYSRVREANLYLSSASVIEDHSVYWNVSGWDLHLLLDAEASIDALRDFLARYPGVPDARLVKYALAVRLARADQYEEAALIYESIRATRRAERMRRLAALHGDVNRSGASAEELLTARYRMAEFIAANPDRIYFNDALWFGMQRYVLIAPRDVRFTRRERERAIAWERKLKDDQEERWRAYQLLRPVVEQSGNTELGRKAAHLSIRCVRGISDRFGRQSEIRAADIEVSAALQRWGRALPQGK